MCPNKIVSLTGKMLGPIRTGKGWAVYSDAVLESGKKVTIDYHSRSKRDFMGDVKTKIIGMHYNGHLYDLSPYCEKCCR